MSFFEGWKCIIARMGFFDNRHLSSRGYFWWKWVSCCRYGYRCATDLESEFVGQVFNTKHFHWWEFTAFSSYFQGLFAGSRKEFVETKKLRKKWLKKFLLTLNVWRNFLTDFEILTIFVTRNMEYKKFWNFFWF